MAKKIQVIHNVLTRLAVSQGKMVVVDTGEHL